MFIESHELPEPKFLDEYLGQDHARQLFETFIEHDFVFNGHPVNAIWIAGPPGVGKSCLVRCALRTYFCPNRVGHTPCKTCEVCTSPVEKLEMLGVKLTFGSTIQDNGVDDVISFMRSASPTGERSFLWIDEAQGMAGKMKYLLDPLEKMHPNITVIFTTMDESKMNPVDLDAIKSRCLPIKLQPFTDKAIAEVIQSKFPFTDEAAKFLAQRVNGNLRNSCREVATIQTYCKNKGIDLPDVDEEILCQLFLGGATPSQRKEFFVALLSGDLETVHYFLDEWCSTTGNHLSQLVQFLLEDMLNFTKMPGFKVSSSLRPIGNLLKHLSLLDRNNIKSTIFKSLVIGYCSELVVSPAELPTSPSKKPAEVPVEAEPSIETTVDTAFETKDLQAFKQLMQCKSLPLLSPF